MLQPSLVSNILYFTLTVPQMGPSEGEMGFGLSPLLSGTERLGEIISLPPHPTEIRRSPRAVVPAASQSPPTLPSP